MVPVKDPAAVVDIRRWVSLDSADQSGGIVEMRAPSTARYLRLTRPLHSGGISVGVELSISSATKYCRFVKAVPNAAGMSLRAQHTGRMRGGSMRVDGVGSKEYKMSYK